jgi:hypothetical protein
LLWLRIAFWTLFLAAAALFLRSSYQKRFEAEGRLSAEGAQARAEAIHIQQTVVLFTKRAVPTGLSFAVFLQKAGIKPDTTGRLIASAQPVFDLRRLRAGNEVSIGRSVLGELREVRYRIDSDHVLSIEPAGDNFHSKIETIPSRTDIVGVAGELHGSLFQSVIDAGEKPELAMRLADIFAFDLDFYTDARAGDTFRVVVEKKILSDGEPASYGRVLAAEYVNGGRP